MQAHHALGELGRFEPGVDELGDDIELGAGLDVVEGRVLVERRCEAAEVQAERSQVAIGVELGLVDRAKQIEVVGFGRSGRSRQKQREHEDVWPWVAEPHERPRVPEPPALEPEKDLRWSLRRPAVRYSVATLGLVSLLFSIASGFASWNPWSLLVVAIVCAVLAFPRFITENIKAIRFPGGGGLDFREPTEPPGAQSVEDLAERPAPSNLSDRRLLLAQLRTAGVGVRNRGILLEPDDLSSWRAEVDRWSNATMDAVEYVNRADAEWLRTLDAVPSPSMC